MYNFKLFLYIKQALCTIFLYFWTHILIMSILLTCLYIYYCKHNVHLSCLALSWYSPLSLTILTPLFQFNKHFATFTARSTPSGCYTAHFLISFISSLNSSIYLLCCFFQFSCHVLMQYHWYQCLIRYSFFQCFHL